MSKTKLIVMENGPLEGPVRKRRIKINRRQTREITGNTGKERKADKRNYKRKKGRKPPKPMKET